MGLGPQGLREGCELRDAKPFPADIRGVIRRTAEVTLGAGIKQEGGTSKSSSGAVWYWQKTEKAP